MQLLFALLSVASATTTLVRKQYNSADLASPVQKVVKLLTDMQTTLRKEEKADEDMFEKLSCWCETNNKGKTAAITEYEAKVQELESEIEGRTKKAQRLADDIVKTSGEIVQLKESYEAGQKLRAKEGAENHAAELDLTKSVEALKGAIIVLKKHQLTAFPQVRLDFLSTTTRSHLRRPDDLDKLSSWMEQHSYGELSTAASHDVEQAVGSYLNTRSAGAAKGLSGYSAQELSTLATAKKLVRSFTQSNAAPYIPQTGEIFGILTQLKEQLEKDLKDVQDKEGQQAANHAELMGQLKTQLSETEKHLQDKETQSADNAKALVDAKESLVDTNKNLDSDSKFLIELKKTCDNADAEWEARSSTRKQEIAAVSEALGMLTTDDSRDLFSSSLGSSFLQVSKETLSRKRAAAVLYSAGVKAHDSQLIALSATVQLDAFVKVKAAINDMISALKQQQEDEVKHKDFCQAELQQNDMSTAAKENEKEDLATKIDSLANQVETLTAEIAAAKASVADMEVQQQRASETRVAESKVFQQTIEEQRATADILKKVLSRLNEFYTLTQTAQSKAFMQQTPQEEEYKSKNVVQPVKFEEYKKSQGASPVLSMIGNLITDAKNLEKEAISDEGDAQQAYETFVKDTNDSRAAKEQEAVDKTEGKATAETAKIQAETDHAAAEGDLEQLAKFAGDLHAACDFVLKNFDVRQGGRGEEITALQSALSFLSGMA